MADFCPEFNPHFWWRCKHQTKIAVHINDLVSSEFLTGPIEVQGHSLAL